MLVDDDDNDGDDSVGFVLQTMATGIFIYICGCGNKRGRTGKIITNHKNDAAQYKIYNIYGKYTFYLLINKT